MTGRAPVAPREPCDVSVHGDPRNDDYYWLRDRDDPRTLPYLRAENAYADEWFVPHAALKERLYQEMLSRIQQDDDSVPMRKGDWWYSTQTRTGEQYPRYLRRRALGAERRFDADGTDEVLLDLNEMARGKAFLRLGLSAVSRDARRLAYSVDHTGGLDFTLHVKDLASGAVDGWSVEQVASAAWANDSRTLYYVTMDEAKRAHRLWRHAVGAPGADELLLEEDDELFDLVVGRTLDERFLLVGSQSKDSSEWRVADADASGEAPFALRTVFARRADIEYDIEHRAGRFYVRINDTGRNFRLVTVDAAAPDLARADELIAARDDVMLDDVDVFAGHLAVTERVAGSLQLRIVDLAQRRRAHGRLRRAGLQRPRRRQRRVRDDDAERRLHLADDAGLDLRLRPGDARARAPKAPAGARLRPGALRQRAHRRDCQGRHRGADLARLPARPEARRARSR